MRTFHGAWPALVSPFSADGQVNVSVLQDLTDHLLAKEVSGLYLCGSTGQGIYMSVAERKMVTETVLAQVQGQVPIIVHVGSQSLRDAVELARHAQKAGAAGISSIIPAGYSDIDSIARYFALVAQAAADLPFLPYLFTSSLNPVKLIQAMEHVPNLAGTKYTGPNMYEFRQVIEARHGSWSVFSGMDEQCVFAAMFGSCGNIGSTLNVIPGIYREIHRNYQNGDLLRARDLQLQANRVTETLISFGFLGALNTALALLGFECGQPRLPVSPFPKNKRPVLQAELEKVDFFEIAAI